VLVVLILIGLMAGVALPRLFSIAQRFEIASQREALLGEIDTLGYRAYTTGKTIALGAVPGSASYASPVSVPAGWRIEVVQPIRYSFTGICSGGEFTLIDPDGSREEYLLTGPRCKPGSTKSTL
jgi:type II secretory pathway pseudopilin PulG